jgi:hypothetical protein
MRADRILFTSESVTEGHPDKLCDQVSDAVLDAILTDDPDARVACETATTTGTVLVAGEVTTSAYVDVNQIVRGVVRDIGYTNADYGFDYQTCGVLTAIKEQSPDIAAGVDEALEAKEGMDAHEIGAGDQGMMFGFAVRETRELMPMPITLAHRVAKELAAARKARRISFLRPDGKSQVTVEYRHGRPVRVDKVVVAAQHDPDVAQTTIREAIEEEVIKRAIPAELLDRNTRYIINATGRFVIGGPMGDAGLTGRQRSDEGRSLRLVHRAVRREERRRRQPRRPLRAPDRVRHRRRAADLAERRDLRHGPRPRRADPAADREARRPAATRDHLALPAAASHLPPDGVVRPLRPSRPRPAVGARRSRRDVRAGSRRRTARRGHVASPPDRSPVDHAAGRVGTRSAAHARGGDLTWRRTYILVRPRGAPCSVGGSPRSARSRSSSRSPRSRQDSRRRRRRASTIRLSRSHSYSRSSSRGSSADTSPGACRDIAAAGTAS